MLGQPVVLFRKRNGDAVAMSDRCPHRHAPLSLGNLVGDEIQCRYHGMQFDCSGACTLVPGETSVPAAMRVAVFRVVEKYGLLWVWIGNAHEADESLLPEWAWCERPGFETYRGVFQIEAPFQMIVDNLMDLTHVHFVHRILGVGNLIHESEPMEVWEERERVFFRRKLNKEAAGDQYVEIGGQYLPPSVVITSGVPKRVGSTDMQPGPVSQVLHCLTPRDAASTRYFVMKCWNVTTREHEITAMHHQNEVTAGEDKVIIEAQWKTKTAFSATDGEKLIRADRAAIMCRRLFAKLLSGELNEAVAETPAEPMSDFSGATSVAPEIRGGQG
jgi:vanillate O-demethylase monooxygenase subunit